MKATATLGAAPVPDYTKSFSGLETPSARKPLVWGWQRCQICYKTAEHMHKHENDCFGSLFRRPFKSTDREDSKTFTLTGRHNKTRSVTGTKRIMEARLLQIHLAGIIRHTRKGKRVNAKRERERRKAVECFDC